MTREEIEKLSVVEPYRFESYFEERWYEVGCIDGLKAADAEPNLKSLWHDASEEPKKYPILCKDEQNYVWTEYSLNDYVDGWDEFVDFNEISQWAYISDLLPKGGER